MSVAKINDDAISIHMASLELITFLSAKGLMPPQPKGPLMRLHANKAARENVRKKK